VALTPIEIELMRNALSSIVDEVYGALMKSAYSTNIKERKDHSSAIFDADGRVVVQGESLPLHLASMLGLVEVVIAHHGKDSLRPGDMFVSNDPYVGKGSHLPDVALVAPVFHDDELVMFVANIAHHADIGGMAPGSISGDMTEIYQEGLRIPPIRLISRGEINPDILELILLNVRIPEERRGDYMAQVAANRLGERRLKELFRKYPPEDVKEACEEVILAAARRLRSCIAELPDGVYAFEDVIDDDGQGVTNIPIKAKVTVSGSEMEFDFDGTGPQVKGSINNSMAGLQASVLFAVKVLLDPDGFTNHGMLDPITIKAPEGTIVNASFPAATAGRSQTCQRIIDCVLGALAQAIPERVIAASNGANLLIAFSGERGNGSHYVYMESIGGGAGARFNKDGTDGVQVHVTNTSNLPIEALEREYPLMIERYEFVPDSGGGGEYRGGLALRRDYRSLGASMRFSVQGERFVSRPWGLFGGLDGDNGHHRILHDDGRVEELAAKTGVVPISGDSVVSITTPGAGGYGDPARRDKERLEDDLRSGKFTETYFKAHYPTKSPD